MARRKPKLRNSDLRRAVESGSLIHYDADRVAAAIPPSLNSGRELNMLSSSQSRPTEIPYLPASDGILIRGARHLLSASAKEGKSLTTWVHSCRMARAGATVVTLDRENGVQIYAPRWKAIMDSWSVPHDERAEIAERMPYVEFPHLRAGDGPDVLAYAEYKCADLVVFDSQRMFLTDMGLNEDDSDDYARFMADIVDPLAEHGIATLALDNVGHMASGRPRGSSSKGDLNEVVFSLITIERFSRERTGAVRLKVEHSRHGQSGPWTMQLGGGTFGEWKSAAGPEGKLLLPSSDEARDLLLAYVREHPGTSAKHALDGCAGHGQGTEKLRVAYRALLDGGQLVRRDDGLHVA